MPWGDIFLMISRGPICMHLNMNRVCANTYFLSCTISATVVLTMATLPLHKPSMMLMVMPCQKLPMKPIKVPQIPTPRFNVTKLPHLENEELAPT